MPSYVALLRAINVGGRNRLGMAALRDLMAELGCNDVQTLLQSGNAVFTHGQRITAALESLLEAETKKRLGLEIDYLVRTQSDLRQAIAKNPFLREAAADPAHLVCMFLKSAPPARAVPSLQAAIRGRETVKAAGKQLYIVYPDGIGPSKFTGTVIEKLLGTRGTARNWNTVLKLAELCPS